MAGPPLRFARAADGTKVCYALLAGVGPPFVFALSPGWAPPTLSLQIRSYASWCERFRRNSPLVVYDHRGFGRSDRGRGDASIEQWMLDLAAVVDAVGGRVHLYGNLGFASVVSRYAAENPERVLSLSLVAPRLKGFHVAPAIQPLVDANYELAVLYFLRTYYDWIDGQRPEDLMREAIAGQKEGCEWVRASRPLEETRLAHFLPGVAAPVHVLGLDVDANRQDAIDTAAMLANAQLTFVTAGQFNGPRGSMWRDLFDIFWRSACGVSSESPAPASGVLSSREADVLRLVSSGCTNAEIAAVLSLSVRTVERHLENIYRKTGAANRAAAVAWAFRQGLA